MTPLSGIRHVAKKELIQTFRDRRMLLMLLLAPALQVVLFGFAVNLDLAAQPIVIVDLDQTAASREVITSLASDASFIVAGYVDSYFEAAQTVTRGDASLAVLIPRGFEINQSTDTAEIMIGVDGSDANTGLRAGQVATEILTQRGLALQQQRLAQTLSALGIAAETLDIGVQIEPRAWFNPSMKTAIFLVPAVLVLVLTIITMVLTSMGLTREKEIGTLEQIMVTPLSSLELILGKVSPFALLGLVDVAVVVAVAAMVFDIPVRGSLVSLFFGSGLFLMTTLGLGLFISTISSTQQQAMLSAFLFVLPALLLSGYMFPVANMPFVVRLVTYVNPLRYYIELTRGIMVKGATLIDLLPQTSMLALLGAIVLVAATRRFHKRLI